MIGFTNRCPKCGKASHFVPEEMECDKSLVAWCKHCGDYISQTLTIETFVKWWSRYDAGEDENKPPISKEILGKLMAIQTEIKHDPECYLDIVEIHLKDFNEYKYTEVEDDDVPSDS